ncbi:MAG: UDP-3-O-acyl-N-acetylglucosamine deacetylase, partial [Candidatus Zambryskibacteria bacterium]|nr:UDP-3-O-acyl-N-acetylglucosamine deacetylase [Candidatus Zambryskibacteria bacterium]
LEKNIISLDNKEKKYFKIKNEIEIVGENGQYCKITPHDDFEVGVSIDFEGIIGKQYFRYAFKENDYIKDVSFARSILIFEISDGEDPWKDYKKHFELMSPLFPSNPKDSPFLAYNKSEYLTPLKDPLEPVKHKLLDFIGDLIYLEKLPLGKFEVHKPGHSFNRRIVQEIWNSYPTSNGPYFEYFLKKVPEFGELKNFIENNNVHKNESVFEHTQTVFNNTLKILHKYKIELSDKNRFRYLLAVFLHDYGKKFTMRSDINGVTSCDGHEEVSAKLIETKNFLDRFNLDEGDKEWIYNFTKNHNQMHEVFSMSEESMKEKFRELGARSKLFYLENLIFSIADLEGSYFKNYNINEYERRLNFLKNHLREFFAV